MVINTYKTRMKLRDIRTWIINGTIILVVLALTLVTLQNVVLRNEFRLPFTNGGGNPEEKVRPQAGIAQGVVNPGDSAETGYLADTSGEAIYLPVIIKTGSVSSHASTTLRKHPDNPRYLTNSSGEVIYLTGSHTWYLIQNNPSRGVNDNSYEYMEEYLDFIQEEHGHNFVRLWINFAYLDTIDGPYPWQRTGPGTARDGKPKFDMTKFDEDYFNLVRERVQQITRRDMYVSVMMFGSFIRFREPATWNYMAWHPDNNINQPLANAFSKNDGYSFFTSDQQALEIQRMLVRKTIDTLNDQDNLIWEVINEADMNANPQRTSHEWQYGMVDYIRSYEANKPKQHLVALNTGGQSGNENRYLYESPADIISPNFLTEDYMNGGPAAYKDKIVVNDTDHLWGVGGDDIWVWKTFTRGNHPIFMDPYDTVSESNDNEGVINPEWDPARAAMGHTLKYANRIDLASAYPSDSSSVCSTKYCLVNPGVGYLFFQPDSGRFTAEISSGEYALEWFSLRSASVVGTDTENLASGTVTFTPPVDGPVVLYLKSTNLQSYPTPYLEP